MLHKHLEKLAELAHHISTGHYSDYIRHYLDRIDKFARLIDQPQKFPGPFVSFFRLLFKAVYV